MIDTSASTGRDPDEWVNNLVDDEDEKLPELGQRLWTVLEKAKPKNLIVDLRHNNGGNTLLYPELLRTLIAFSREPGNQIYVLIGRRTYSATANKKKLALR